jgi:hypothetical protein
MNFDDEYAVIVADIMAEWNKAEADIKTAEMVVSKIGLPSVKELRYAGRRLVEAFALIFKDQDGASKEKIKALLEDARFDCHRARHDAVDAATAKIAADMEIMAKQLGYDAILPTFPQFPHLTKKVIFVRSKIIESRKNREDRDAIYSVIESVDLPELVSSFNELISHEQIMVAIAKKRRAEHFYGKWGFWVAVFFGLVAVADLLFHIFK